MGKIKVGIIGCGNISSIYMENIPTFENLELVACADLDLNKAHAQAEKYQISRSLHSERIVGKP